MNGFPRNTRNDYRNERDVFQFQSMPTPLNTSYGEVQPNLLPNYDRNMFSGQGHVEFPARKIVNDRLMETSEIYRNFGQNTNTIDYQNALNTTNSTQVYTRERRDMRHGQEEQRNMDRIFMNSYDYNNDVNNRMQGFDLIARDTRFEDDRKKGNNQVEMRSNRYLGMPSDIY